MLLLFHSNEEHDCCLPQIQNMGRLVVDSVVLFLISPASSRPDQRHQNRYPLRLAVFSEKGLIGAPTQWNNTIVT